MAQRPTDHDGEAEDSEDVAENRRVGEGVRRRRWIDQRESCGPENLEAVEHEQIARLKHIPYRTMRGNVDFLGVRQRHDRDDAGDQRQNEIRPFGNGRSESESSQGPPIEHQEDKG